MDDQILRERLEAIEQKVDKMQTTFDKFYSFLWWATVISIAVFVLPLIGLVFAIPWFISSLGDITSIAI